MNRFLYCTVLLVACNSCRGGRDTEGTTQQQPETPGKTGTASIRGSITFKGTVPATPSFS